MQQNPSICVCNNHRVQTIWECKLTSRFNLSSFMHFFRIAISSESIITQVHAYIKISHRLFGLESKSGAFWTQIPHFRCVMSYLCNMSLSDTRSLSLVTINWIPPYSWLAPCYPRLEPWPLPHRHPLAYSGEPSAGRASERWDRGCLYIDKKEIAYWILWHCVTQFLSLLSHNLV